jgi:hypothetical protein
MLVLLAVRMLYYISIEYIVNIANQDENQGFFNLWLILPYATEIILNCVIFYFNFIKENFGSNNTEEKEEEEEESNPVVMISTQMPPDIPTATTGTLRFGGLKTNFNDLIS